MNIAQQEQQHANATYFIEEGEQWVRWADGGRRRLALLNKKNAARMYVDGTYVAKSHPLWKSGRYNSFNDAAFSSFTNYSQSTKGDVYVITNDAWPEWIKVGKAIDASDRLKSYQTSDPFRAYSLRYSVSLANRHTSEVKAHKALELLSDDRKNEWFKIDLSKAVACLGALSE